MIIKVKMKNYLLDEYTFLCFKISSNAEKNDLIKQNTTLRSSLIYKLFQLNITNIFNIKIRKKLFYLTECKLLDNSTNYLWCLIKNVLS